jgi:hypothetical protein
MFQLLDVYVIQARLVPMFILLLPITLTTLAWLPRGATDYIWGILGTLGAVVLLAELGRDQGKHKESALFRSWGGGPATLILSHRHSWLDQHTLLRYHAKLQLLMPTLQLPTLAEEEQQTDDALVKYESCVLYLRQVTRERTRFPLIFAENVSYGFRRNLWALRPTGIVLTLLFLGINGIFIYRTMLFSESLPIAPFVVFVLEILLLVLWIMRFRPRWVETAARAYAERLVAACENL